MKKIIVLFLILLISLLVYKQKSKQPTPNFYKNLYTEEVLNKSEFEDFYKNIVLKYIDTDKGKAYIDSMKSIMSVTLRVYDLIGTDDSIILPFNYDIRIGNEYIVRAKTYEKIGMEAPERQFQTLKGDSIQIGGVREKPMLINLWFVECSGCVAEMPALNRLQEKYENKVDFVAITFESKKKVTDFLRLKKFNFEHITDAKDFIKEIGTNPYPESIFINRAGRVQYIESVLSSEKNLDLAIKHFEGLLDKMLNE